MTPEIEKALSTVDAQRLVRVGMSNHADDLKKHAKNDEDDGYPQAASQKRGDATFINEVMLPAFGAQTGLELDQEAEVKAYIASMIQRRFSRIVTQITGYVRAGKDDVAQELLLLHSNGLGEEIGHLAVMIATRAHHDGITARSLAPNETIGRVLRERADAPHREDTV